ncbi:MAG: TonB-dependent receptor [Candidatus Hydrogenedentes bacterium]|nr:TonB-dependent receptor [Candidatus Hydrogenedentota bacterium]
MRTWNGLSWCMSAALVACAALPSGGAAGDDLTNLSLEELLDIEVTSVSKRPEKRREASAAIFVITSDDIRRSGATNIPDLLRMVPGVNVAQQTSSTFHVSARGFNGRFANKLLVLVDGRSVYTPLFSGVFWGTMDLALDDIERIEVVRGPGGTLWGANAVNGVINIVTKPAKATQGGQATVGLGTEESFIGALRYGGKASDALHYRVYSSFKDHDSFAMPDGSQGEDAWLHGRLGVRLDWEKESDSFVFLADGFNMATLDSDVLPTMIPPFVETDIQRNHQRGGQMTGRYTHQFADESEVAVQVYYDLYSQAGTLLDEQRHTVDLDFQYRFDASPHHHLVVGGGYRLIRDNIENGPSINFDPDDRTSHIFNLYLQDQIDLIPDELTFTVGLRLEHNDFSALEAQPNMQLAWRPGEQHAVWGAVSRAVRTPSLAESDAMVDFLGLPFTFASLTGNDKFDAEDLLSWELGYRYAASPKFTVDLALFYNQYSDLRTLGAGIPGADFSSFPPHLLVPLLIQNELDADTYGVEVALDWQALDWWRMRLNYTWFDYELDDEAGLLTVFAQLSEGDTPEHQLWFQHSFQLSPQWELDAIVRYASKLPVLDVDEYWTADLRLGWKARENLEFALVGRNLFDSQHYETKAQFVGTTPTEVERGIYGSITWRF